LTSPLSPFAPPSLSPADQGDELDALRTGVVVVTPDWEVVRWNRAMVIMTGIGRADALGRPLWSSLPELAGTEAEDVLREAMRARRRWTGLLFPCGEHDDAPVVTAITPFGDANLLVEVERTAPIGALPLTELQVAMLNRMLANALGRRAVSEALAEVARELASASANLAGVLELLAERTSRLLEAEGACIGLLQEDGSLCMEVAVGILAPLAGVRVGAGPGLARLAIDGRAIVISNDVRNDARADRRWVERCDARQIAFAPLIVGDVVVGVTGAANFARGEFTAADGVLLQRLADHGALAVRNGRLLRDSERALRHANILAASARTSRASHRPRSARAESASTSPTRRPGTSRWRTATAWARRPRRCSSSASGRAAAATS
jgi:hypothetical protein